MTEEEKKAAEAISSEAEIETLPEGIDDPQVLKAEIAKKDKAIRQIHARAIKAETLLKERSKDSEIINPPAPSLDINDEAVNLRFDGYSIEEVKWIMKNGGRKELENPESYTSIAINTRREQLNAEKAASQTQQSSGQSEVERKYTPEQLNAMPLKELEAILPRVS